MGESTEITVQQWMEDVRQRALKAKAESPGTRKQTSPQVHVPIPRNFQLRMRERIFMSLGRQACIKAQRLKGEEELSRSEVFDICEKLRAELQRRGFFEL